MISLRVAGKEDVESILAIYAPYVNESNTSFEYEVSEASAFAQQMEDLLEQFPWLVAENDGEVVGYAFAKKHRERAAYQWCAESSIYVKQDFQAKGVGRVLYEALLAILAAQNYVNLYAGISQPNEASTMFHVKMGFTPVGVYKKIGFKNGQWHDVVWLHRTLLKHVIIPETPLKFSDEIIRQKTTEILTVKTAEYNSKATNQ